MNWLKKNLLHSGIDSFWEREQNQKNSLALLQFNWWKFTAKLSFWTFCRVFCTKLDLRKWRRLSVFFWEVFFVEFFLLVSLRHLDSTKTVEKKTQPITKAWELSSNKRSCKFKENCLYHLSRNGPVSVNFYLILSKFLQK